MGNNPMVYNAPEIMVSPIPRIRPLHATRELLSILVTNKVNIVEVIVDHTSRSNNMVDMEAFLQQDLPSQAHSGSRGGHGT